MWLKKIVGKISPKKKKSSTQDEDNVKKMSLFLFGVYIVIYFFFVGKDAIPPGVGLEKKDWLSFLGSYLSFAGTLFVCYITLSQNKVFMQRAEEQKREDRFNKIQPILSVEVTTKDKSRMGCEEDLKKDEDLILKEFTFSIKNLGAFPALHVRVFNDYLLPALAPGETLKFVCGYDIKTTVQIPSNNITIQLPSGCSGVEPPIDLSIEYYDVDGHSMVQRFHWEQYRTKELYVLFEKQKL